VIAAVELRSILYQHHLLQRGARIKIFAHHGCSHNARAA
jgi:hypothetical protein